MENKEKNKKNHILIAVVIALGIVALIQIVSYSGNYGCSARGGMMQGYSAPVSIIAGVIMFLFWGLIVFALILFVIWIINQLNKENEIESVTKVRKKK